MAKEYVKGQRAALNGRYIQLFELRPSQMLLLPVNIHVHIK